MVSRWLVIGALVLASCGVTGGGDVSGWPEVDLGVPVEVYKVTPERDLHLHVFEGEISAGQDATGAVVFFHGGGFRSTRVEQFERQARAVAAAGMVGIVAEYRVTAEGTTRADAIVDGLDALAFVRSRAAEFRVDSDRIAVAGASAGGALAIESAEYADALVLFNPAVGQGSASFVDRQPVIVFHSRQDTIVPFTSAEAFCNATPDCRLVAFEEGDHGFFNDEPAFAVTRDRMIEFLEGYGW